MASDVDIANLALAHIGDAATVASLDPAEGSAQAQHCARFFPMARDSVLEAHDWNFASRRIVLSLLSDVPVFGWDFAYAIPNDCLKVRHVVDADDTTKHYDFVREDDGTQGAILTNKDDACAMYTMRITNNGKFPPLVVTAISYLLASYISGPVIKGDLGRAVSEKMLAQFQFWFARAVASDASQRKTVDDALSHSGFIPSAIAAR